MKNSVSNTVLYVIYCHTVHTLFFYVVKKVVMRHSNVFFDYFNNARFISTLLGPYNHLDLVEIFD